MKGIGKAAHAGFSPLIVAQQKTAEIMRDFEREKQFLLPYVDNDRKVFSDVRLRLPDLVLNEYLELDLGGRLVELHHLGHGNTPGDTVVYVPEARVLPKHRWSVISLPMLSRGSYPPSRWDAWAHPRRLPRPRYSLPRMIPVSSRA